LRDRRGEEKMGERRESDFSRHNRLHTPSTSINAKE
jgi:hypothetical protein